VPLPARCPRRLRQMGIALNDEIRRLLDGRDFAVLAAVNPTAARRRHRCGSAATARRAVLHGRRTTQAPQPPARPACQRHRARRRGPLQLRRAAGSRDDRGNIGPFDTALSWTYHGRDPDPDPPGAVVTRAEHRAAADAPMWSDHPQGCEAAAGLPPSASGRAAIA
jgi:hypothetical protein